MNEKNIEYRSENFYIRKTDDRDYDNFRKVCEAEYLIGRIYKHQPKIAMKCFWETLFEGEDFPSRWGVFRKSQFAIWKMQISGDCHCSSKEVSESGVWF